ncbi:antitoxin Xre/MbcA/ParS toxin-binding domain-containing protein [Ectopseudomonas khazarica]|uniref:antitoxin Xre/MbcA/ParS toxin-binding domain-containing protein n=1 Tax=Ectopseudomonas khazarica TaxID=2502979 RepID=UPI003B940CA6
MKEKAVDKEVYAAALKLFKNKENAEIWMNRPQLALGDLKPIDAHPGEVLRLIGQLENGVHI